RLATLQQLTSRAARSMYFAIAAWLVFWFGVAWLSWSRPAGVAWWKALLSLVFTLMSVPNFIDQVAHPWAAAVPALSAALAALLAATLIQVLRSDELGVSAQRAVLAITVGLLLAACASHTPRHETRYVFFLFPTIIVLAVTTLTSWVAVAAGRRCALAALVTVPLCLGAFMLSEDFQL